MTTILSNTQTNVQLFVLGLAILASAILFGLVASTGSQILVLLFVGLLGGAVLTARPTWLLWMAVSWTLLAAGLLRYFADVRQADWLVYASAFAFWLVALLAIFRVDAPKDVKKIPLPTFVIFFLVFYIVGIFASLTNFEGTAQLFVGVKNYVLLFGIFLALSAGAYTIGTIRKLAPLALAVALLQLPVCLYQFLFVRQRRIEQGGYAMFDSLVEASDSVVGTMGGQKLGGGLDDVLALFALTVLAGVLIAYRGGLLKLKYTALLSVLIVVPVLLSETKVIFIYFPIIVTVVAWDILRKRPHYVLVGLLVAPAVIYGMLFTYYQIHWSKQFASLEQSVEHVFAYSFEERATGARAAIGDMTRRESIEFWWQNHSISDLDKLLLGHGFAQSKMYSSVVLPKTVREYGFRNLGKTGASQLLWDTGIVGGILFVGGIIFAARAAATAARAVPKNSTDFVLLKGAQAGLLLMAVSLFYRNSALNVAQSGFLLFLMLGLVAFYSRNLVLQNK